MRWRARCPRRARATPLWRCQTGATWRCLAAATRTATCSTAASPSSTPPPGAGPPPRSRSAPTHSLHARQCARENTCACKSTSWTASSELSGGLSVTFCTVQSQGSGYQLALRLPPSTEKDMISIVSAAYPGKGHACAADAHGSLSCPLYLLSALSQPMS